MRNKTALVVMLSMVMINVLEAQRNILIEGFVRDSVSKEPIVSATVAVAGTVYGTATDAEGRFWLKVQTDSAILAISSVGYNSVRLPVKQGYNNYNVRLAPIEYELNEVTVRPKRYSRKNNPAVDFILEMLRHRDDSDPLLNEYYSYDAYEQRVIFFEGESRSRVERDSNLMEKSDAAERTVSKRGSSLDFALEYVDTLTIPGIRLLPVYSEEMTEGYYYRRKPRTEKRMMSGFRRGGLIEMVSEDGVKGYIDEIVQDINIFQDNMELMLHRFVSPLSSIGQYYYKYYITDTVVMGGERCVQLLFSPFSRESFGFVGTMWVTLDTTWFVKRIEMKTPHGINLNYVDELTVEQEFARGSNGSRLLERNVIGVRMMISKRLPIAYGRRTAIYSNHSFAMSDVRSLYEDTSPVMEVDSARERTAGYWDAVRTKASPELRDYKTDSLMNHLREIPFFFWWERLGNIFINGYVQTSTVKERSYFEIGHVNTFISGNTIEGTRLKFGGNTTVNMSPHFFVDAHLAYGIHDRKLKPDIFVEYSFNRKRNFRNEFPYNYLRLGYKYDIHQIGQHYLYTNPDNVFLMFKRRDNNLLTYQQKVQLSYFHESYGGFAYNINIRRLREWSTPYVPFNEIVRVGEVRSVSHYTSSQAELHLRYAPGEKFYESRNARYPIHYDAPILTFTHTIARKGVLGSDHNYNRTEVGVRKRFWLSPLGYADLLVQGGKVWDRAPYPLLLIPNANLSYTIQEETFALLDPMEFIHDRYVSWDMTWKPKGALFNRIPVFKHLKLREIVGFRGWYGQLSDRNNPEKEGVGLYELPSGTTMMGRKPYMEMSVGLSNIFKILRLDYVWRMSYRNRAEVPDNGIRIKLEFSY
jgi:hypothetical protein